MANKLTTMTNALLNTKRNLRQNLVPWRAYFIALHEKNRFVVSKCLSHLKELTTLFTNANKRAAPQPLLIMIKSFSQ